MFTYGTIQFLNYRAGSNTRLFAQIFLPSPLLIMTYVYIIFADTVSRAIFVIGDDLLGVSCHLLYGSLRICAPCKRNDRPGSRIRDVILRQYVHICMHMRG